MAKPELEFFDTEPIPWKPIEGSPGHYEKILSMDPETGSYTRLLYCQPDFEKSITTNREYSKKMFVREDMWIEVFLLNGMSFDITQNVTAKSGYYACRPPSMKYGPFLHPIGVLCFEVISRFRSNMAKPKLHYFDTEPIPWKPIEGSPGHYEKILSMDPETGSYTRLLYCQPDFEKLVPGETESLRNILCHDDMWEEVFVISGTGFGTSANKTFANKTYRSGYYACRPPEMKHGPFLHPTGAICLEVRTKLS